jgi:hypothetical protein
VNFGRRPTLEEEFDKLEDDDIEKELEAMKSDARDRGESTE